MSTEERVVSDLVWTPERGGETPEVRGISWENFLLSDDKYLGKWKTDSGIRITPETALQSTVVLSCCRILAETVSGLPIHVYRRSPDGGDDIAKEIPLYKILTFRPNDWQTKQEFFEQIVMNLTLWGNSYTRIRSGQYGSVSCLDNLHPSRMEVERLENGRLRYSYTDPETGRLERYTQDQIMHVRWTPEQDGIKGMVPVEIAREAIGLARACEQHAARFWANSARPGVVLQTDGTLNAEAAERLRDNWERLHRGSERAFRTAVLTGGMKAVELGMTNESSQFVASRDFQTAEICRVYRIAQHLIQGTPGGDLEVQGQEFVTYTLMPWLNRIESSISRSLIYNDDEYYAKFDVRGLLRANSQQRASYYSTMTSLGIMTINDCRRAEGLKPLGPVGDHHFVAMNMQTLEDATKPKPEAPPGGMPGMPGPPPPTPGGPPSLPEVKTGKAPIESPKGEASTPKAEPEMEEAVEEASADWEEAVEDRAFCSTGPGGGIDNSCGAKVMAGPDKDSGGGASTGERNKRNPALRPALDALPKDVPADHKLLINHKQFVPVIALNEQFVRVPTDDELVAAMGDNAVADEKDTARENIGGVSGKSISEGDSWIGFHRNLPAGTPVAFRIDIPTFNNTKDSGNPVYSVTVHEDNGKGNETVGKRIGYDGVARLSGPVTFTSKEKVAILIAGGAETKSPLATVKGQFDPSREVPGDINSWTPVGYDPQKAAYFYDKKTGREVKGGVDAVSVGNTVFTRQPDYGDRYAQHQYRHLADSWGLESRGFCPTGEGGGIENTCDSSDGSQAKPDGDKTTSGSGSGSCPAPCHTVDVTSDKNEDGVTDAARVGVPAMEVPPPPNVGRVPNLTPHERSVEDAFMKHFIDDPDKVSAQFLELVKGMGEPPTFGTDDAKCLTDAWSHPDPDTRAKNRATLNVALHQTANAIAKRAFVQHLDTLSKGDEILVTVGGCGAGKGFALKNNPDALAMKSKAAAVWDSAGDQNATENPWILKEAEDRGLKVNFVFVHADPKVQWADPDRGVVKRAADPKDGRMVDAMVFADSYAIGAKNHHAFHQANKDNPSASFVFLDNTGKPKQIPGVPKEALELDSASLAEFAQSKVKESSAPERVKSGALVGTRIWKRKGK
jgi:HK97 family phage portal protein